MKNYLKFLAIDDQSITPKYLQLINSILRGIEQGLIEKNDLLPSINDLSYGLETSRNTIERAYSELKKSGVIGSVAGKGYFILNTEFEKPIRVFLLFNKLSSHKKIIYDAFVETLGENADIDFYIYNNSFALFKKLLKGKMDNNYSKVVIVPHFIEGGENAHEIINTIPPEKLIIMDKIIPKVAGNYGIVYEDFEKDVYNALEQMLEKLNKYQTIKIIFPDNTYHSKDIIPGIQKFCDQYAFNSDIVRNLSIETIEEKCVYITVMEDDLVLLIEKILETKMRVGKEVGVISYNETPLKKMILNGITTISTDFKMMGEKAAQMILNNSSECIALPFSVHLRSSL